MPTSIPVPIRTHYYQFDQQGVVFNMWYLAFLEEARNGYLAARGFSLQHLLDSGHDIQVVHSTIDWSGPATFGDEVIIDARPGRVGTTSFSLDFAVLVNGVQRATAAMAYVIVDAEQWVKAQLPAGLRAALDG